MSITVMTCVWEQSHHKGSDLLLLLAIADQADDAGIASPSIPLLARKTRMTERNVQYRLRLLMDSQELDIHPNAGPQRTHLFRIKIPGEQTAPGAGCTPQSSESDGEKFSGVKSVQGEVFGNP